MVIQGTRNCCKQVLKLICFQTLSFLTREFAHAHEQVTAIVGFSLGLSVGWLVQLLTFGHAQ